jgi:hypothetical protein
MLSIETAKVLQPLLARYKGAWGGRGSGKSHFFAGAVVEHCPNPALALSSASSMTGSRRLRRRDPLSGHAGSECGIDQVTGRLPCRVGGGSTDPLQSLACPASSIRVDGSEIWFNRSCRSGSS